MTDAQVKPQVSDPDEFSAPTRRGHDALGIDARAYRGVAAAFTELARVI